MNNLKLILTGSKRGDMFVCIDGNPVENFQKDENGNRFCMYTTESEKVRLSVHRYLDLGGFIWFIAQIFFFIISIFGLFDVHGKARWLSADCQIDVNLKEVSNITVKLNNPSKKGRVADFITYLQMDVISNNFVLEPKTKTIRTLLTLAKLLTAVAVIIVAVMCI